MEYKFNERGRVYSTGVHILSKCIFNNLHTTFSLMCIYCRYKSVVVKRIAIEILQSIGSENCLLV